MNKRFILIIGAVLVVVAASLSALAFKRTSVVDKRKNDGDASSTIIRSESSGLSMSRSLALQEQVVKEEDRRQGQEWSLSEPIGSMPQFSITAVYVEDKSMRKLASVTGKPLPNAVLENVIKQLRRQYEKHAYKQVSQRVYDINGYDSAEVVFDYNSGSKIIRQRLVLLFKDEISAVYIRGQVEAGRYQDMNAPYFEPLLKSAKFE